MVIKKNVKKFAAFILAFSFFNSVETGNASLIGDDVERAYLTERFKDALRSGSQDNAPVERGEFSDTMVEEVRRFLNAPVEQERFLEKLVERLGKK